MRELIPEDLAHHTTVGELIAELQKFRPEDRVAVPSDVIYIEPTLRGTPSPVKVDESTLGRGVGSRWVSIKIKGTGAH